MNATPLTSFSALDNSKRLAIMGAVMLALFLSAMDQTIVGTALPRIIADLSGLELYAWVFTSYMLMSTTFVPIIGKAGDVYGRKPLMIGGVVIFLAGSVLCGMSQSMVQLIVFRGLQGIGGGFIFANAFAIVGDLFTPAERGRYMGLMSAVFGLASVIGPLIGGGITDNLSWRWVFYVNIPLGLAALLVLAAVLPRSARHDASRRIDYAGAVALAASIAPLLLAFSWAGTDYAWTSPQVIVPMVLAALAFMAFVAIELRADDPVVPPEIFRNRVFAVATAVTFVTGAAMFSGTVYIPLFMQGVLDFSATNAGLVLTPMTLALVLGSIISGQIISRTGSYRWLNLIGLVVATSGMYLLSTMDAGSSQITGMRDMAIVGFGLGLSIPSLMLASQNAVVQPMLGVATSMTQFARSVGGVIGVAIMGSLLTRRLEDELVQGLPQEVQARAPAPLLDALANPRVLLDDGVLGRLHDQGFGAVFGTDADRLFAESIASIQSGLAAAITDVFLIATGIMMVALTISVFLRDLPLRAASTEIPEAEEPPRPETERAARPAPLETAPSPAQAAGDPGGGGS